MMAVSSKHGGHDKKNRNRKKHYFQINTLRRMAAYTKAFTGLTGMAVSKNPTHTLGVLYRYSYAADDFWMLK